MSVCTSGFLQVCDFSSSCSNNCTDVSDTSFWNLVSKPETWRQFLVVKNDKNFQTLVLSWVALKNNSLSMLQWNTSCTYTSSFLPGNTSSRRLYRSGLWWTRGQEHSVWRQLDSTSKVCKTRTWGWLEEYFGPHRISALSRAQSLRVGYFRTKIYG